MKMSEQGSSDVGESGNGEDVKVDRKRNTDEEVGAGSTAHKRRKTAMMSTGGCAPMLVWVEGMKCAVQFSTSTFEELKILAILRQCVAKKKDTEETSAEVASQDGEKPDHHKNWRSTHDLQYNPGTENCFVCRCGEAFCPDALINLSDSSMRCRLGKDEDSSSTASLSDEDEFE